MNIWIYSINLTEYMKMWPISKKKIAFTMITNREQKENGLNAIKPHLTRLMYQVLLTIIETSAKSTFVL